ncbi:hypothetical protein EJ110_NYTH37472 [Nymphaea thermarum]|nr:hypothetical protein EJ110_NYTH37472 [Nymphaea thermarum]
MADCAKTLLHAMDFFWFRHNILSPKPPSPLHHRAMELVNPSPELPTAESPLLLKEQHFSSLPELVLSPLSEVDDECTTRRASSLELVREDETSSWSSSSKVQSSPLSPPAIKLQRTGCQRRGRIRSCKSLSELERDELKGFMDLGFTFKREELNPRMISMIPGLQGLEAGEEPSDSTVKVKVRDSITRPYLSEAWLINRPDSPLLNFKIPRVPNGGTDMKKHLRFWARTVALAIQQES